ncbi:MAG: hypothetical protein GY953_34580, partial [bacterium]|nr:hypothetical protein [bacterium]
MKRISCEACHIPALHRASALGFETTSGKLNFIINPPAAAEFGEIASWKPVYERREDQKIHPFNAVQAIWWGNLDADGVLHPLFLREHEAGWKTFSDQVADDNGDGAAEVNREEEIVAGLQAFAKTLEGNQRFDRIHPALVKGNQVYQLDAAGNLAILDYDLQGMGEVKFSLTHIVAPASQALGANGCVDCHDDDAHMFTGQRVVDLYGAGGQPVTKSNGLFFGCRPFAFFLNSLHQRILSPVVSIAVVLVVFLIVVHYHSYGPKRIEFVPFSHEVRRFSLLERGVHLSRMVSFFMLTGTGLIMAFNL